MNEPFLPSSLPGVYQNVASQTTSSSTTGVTGTYTLPSGGVWLVTVAAKLGGSLDQMMSGTWLVNCYDGINDTLLSAQLGSTAKSAGASFGLSALTLSNPTSAGVLTATSTWTDGASHPIIYVFTAVRIATYA